jgi:hypothetical protein
MVDIVGTAVRMCIRPQAITEAAKAARLVPISLQIPTIQVTAARQIVVLIRVTADIAITVLRMWQYPADITEAGKVA